MRCFSRAIIEARRVDLLVGVPVDGDEDALYCGEQGIVHSHSNVPQAWGQGGLLEGCRNHLACIQAACILPVGTRLRKNSDQRLNSSVWQFRQRCATVRESENFETAWRSQAHLR